MSTGPYGPTGAGPGPAGAPGGEGSYGAYSPYDGTGEAGGYPTAPGYAGTPPVYPAGYPPAYAAAGYVPNAVTYGAYPTPRNGLGTAALVLGIIGIVFCWIPFTGWALNILAVIFGAIGRKRALAGQATNKSSAVAGLVMGVIGLAVWIVILIIGLTAFNSATYWY